MISISLHNGFKDQSDEALTKTTMVYLGSPKNIDTPNR